MDPTASRLLEVWFGPLGSEPPVGRWFRKDPAFDAELRAAFGDDLDAAARGERDAWITAEAPARGLLALVILLDQLSRNVFRDTPRAFSQDARALALAVRAVDEGLDRALPWLERYALYMPFMHAEDRGAQARGIELFTRAADEADAGGAPEGTRKLLRGAVDYAKQHAVIVERFGRFPHRNAMLGRASTAEELAFLEQPGSRF